MRAPRLSSLLSFPSRAVVTPVRPAVRAAVSTVEEVQQRTCEEQEIRQDPEEVGGVLGHKEESSDDQEANQHEA